MRRRLYWLLPDVPAGRAAMEDLLRAGVARRHVHFTAREDCDLSGLNAANVLHTSDVVRSAEAGMVAGAAFGGLLGAFAAVNYPGAGEAARWDLIPALVLAGAVLDAWTSSMIGISSPNRRLRRFARAIRQGSILLMVDVPVERIADIEARLQALCPQGRPTGAEPDSPAFP